MGQLRQSAHGSLDGVQFAPRDLVAGAFRVHPGNIGKIPVHARVPDQSVGRHDSVVEFHVGREKRSSTPSSHSLSGVAKRRAMVTRMASSAISRSASSCISASSPAATTLDIEACSPCVVYGHGGLHELSLPSVKVMNSIVKFFPTLREGIEMQAPKLSLANGAFNCGCGYLECLSLHIPASCGVVFQ